eukprot:Skav219594  [mRNA]  locus=scaffold1719:130143:130571:+ [translate_table: standard]
METPSKQTRIRCQLPGLCEFHSQTLAVCYENQPDDHMQLVALPEEYMHEQLVEDLAKVSSSAEMMAWPDQERWIMNARAALLWEACLYRNALQVEQRYQKLSLNRNKLTKARAMLKKGGLPAECPEEFPVGQGQMPEVPEEQ